MAKKKESEATLKTKKKKRETSTANKKGRSARIKKEPKDKPKLTKTRKKRGAAPGDKKVSKKKEPSAPSKKKLNLTTDRSQGRASSNRKIEPERELITQKEYAERIGKTKQYVGKLVKKGVIKLHKIGKRELVDPAQADTALKSDKDENDKLNYYDELAKKTKLQAELLEIEKKEKEGKLFDVEVFMPKVDAALEKTLYAVRQKLFAIPTKGTPRLAQYVPPKMLPQLQEILEELSMECADEITKIDVEKLISKKKS